MHHGEAAALLERRAAGENRERVEVGDHRGQGRPLLILRPGGKDARADRTDPVGHTGFVLQGGKDFWRVVDERIGEIHEAQSVPGATEGTDAAAPIAAMGKGERTHYFFFGGGSVASRIAWSVARWSSRSEEHTSELQSLRH